MKVEKEHVITYKLTISYEDAKKMMLITQNSLWEDEPEEWALFREKVFNSLREAGVELD